MPATLSRPISRVTRTRSPSVVTCADGTSSAAEPCEKSGVRASFCSKTISRVVSSAAGRVDRHLERRGDPDEPLGVDDLDRRSRQPARVPVGRAADGGDEDRDNDEDRNEPSHRPR